MNDRFVATLEGRLPGQHLVEDEAEAVDIASVIDLMPTRLLGRHVHRRTDPCTRHGETGEHLATGNTEVHEFDGVRRQRERVIDIGADSPPKNHDVGRLDITVDNAG